MARLPEEQNKNKYKRYKHDNDKIRWRMDGWVGRVGW